MEISLCMIVRNEAQHLARCLDSVRDAVDEIIILDTGSTDETMEIARRYTEQVFTYPWQDDFAAARNMAFSYASKPYLMWMDADDVMEKSEREKLIELRPALNGSIDAVMMPYVCDVRADGTPAMVFDRERIVRRAAGFRFEGAVHEAMSVSGRIIREDIAIRHMGRHSERSNRRNLAIYERLIARGAAMAARDWHYYARELMTAGREQEAEAVFERVIHEDCWTVIRMDAMIKRAQCLLKLDRIGEARAQLLCALASDAPSAELLCAMGACEMQAGRDAAAAFWYRAARLAEKPKDSGAFVYADCYDYIPSMQLCVLLDRMGRTQEAAMENERALIAHPNDAAAMRNRAYFAGKKGGESSGESLEPDPTEA
ncbi:MAG: glycosyltransferase family 2 protein [Clostridia bacterium]|nr:glycosyltransferase family 2 protein [Clostridia bacterium]